MSPPAMPFAADPFSPSRRETRVVSIGDVEVGGRNPIRIQSMTSADTRDTRATCDEISRLVDAGCEIVRVTAPSITDAENLAAIRAELRSREIRVPLVADIHFAPNAAMVAALHVEKVRVNPGNYADKKHFEVREYDDAQYREEIERVSDRFRPLVLRCKELGRVLRIGTNHGSLSDRVMNRYGDTPAGMVESALEFLDVCEAEGFRDVLFSMKASNARVAIQAYRLLAARLGERRPDEPGYPFHLGVTEAGDGEDGRIKSAIGIGALLEDGIGDTIRVSLTEDSVREIPVARALARRYDQRWAAHPAGIASPGDPGGLWVDDPKDPKRRTTRVISCAGVPLGGGEPVRVELEIGAPAADPGASARALARSLTEVGDLACEGLLLDVENAAALERARALVARLAEEGLSAPVSMRTPPLLAAEAADLSARTVVSLPGVYDRSALDQALAAARTQARPLEWNLRVASKELPELVDTVLEASVGCESLLFSLESELPLHSLRWLASRLQARGRGDVPIILRGRAGLEQGGEESLIRMATDLGSALCDGIGDVIVLPGADDPGRNLALAYRILQGARLRTTWTEFISCPSCGRTLFDLEETTARIKARTQHLPGIKIAIMGCIVNGPGEMADADFGYVGSGPGRVNLYVGREVVERNVSQDEAEERLIALIRSRGRWLDP